MIRLVMRASGKEVEEIFCQIRKKKNEFSEGAPVQPGSRDLL